MIRTGDAFSIDQEVSLRARLDLSVLAFRMKGTSEAFLLPGREEVSYWVTMVDTVGAKDLARGSRHGTEGTRLRDQVDDRCQHAHCREEDQTRTYQERSSDELGEKLLSGPRCVAVDA